MRQRCASQRRSTPPYPLRLSPHRSAYVALGGPPKSCLVGRVQLQWWECYAVLAAVFRGPERPSGRCSRASRGVLPTICPSSPGEVHPQADAANLLYKLGGRLSTAAFGTLHTTVPFPTSHNARVWSV
jgi:hypothetical protein